MIDSERQDLCPADFQDVETVIASASRLLAYADKLRFFCSEAGRQSIGAVRLIGAAKSWVRGVQTHINSYTAAQAFKLVDAYDVVHRVAFNGPAEPRYIKDIILAAFDAMIHGDKDVDEYQMFKAVSNAVGRQEPAFLGKPLTWSCLTLERWHREAIEGFDTSQLTENDIQSRVKILLESELYAFEGRNEKLFKEWLTEKYCCGLTTL